MQPTATIEIDNVYGTITSEISHQALAKIHQECTYNVLTYATGKRKPRISHIRLFHKSRKRFRIGLLPRVIGILNDYNYDVNLLSKYKPSTKTLQTAYVGPKLWPHQVEAAAKAQVYKRGVIMMATGGGKTIMFCSLLASLGRRGIVLVHRSDLLLQTYNVVKKCITGCEIGYVGDGEFKEGDILVASIHTVAKCINVASDRDAYVVNALKNANVVILDEAHIAPIATIKKILPMCTSADFVYGVSATPDHMDGKELELESAFGETIMKINATDMAKTGAILLPKIYFVVKEMPSSDSTHRVTYGDRYSKTRNTVIAKNDDYINRAIQVSTELLRRGRVVMVLSRTNTHARKIASQLNAPFVTSSIRIRDREKIWNSIRNGDCNCVVCNSQIAGAGLDIPRLDAAVLADDWANAVIYRQIIGRFLRAYDGKSDAIICDLVMQQDENDFRRVHEKTKLLRKIEPGFNVCGPIKNIDDIWNR